MLKLTNRLRADGRGATAIEYGLIVALIFVASAGAMEAFGASVIDMWDFVTTSVLEA